MREVLLSTLLLSFFHIEKCNNFKFRLSGICPLHKDDTHQTIGALLLWLKKSGACRCFRICRNNLKQFEVQSLKDFESLSDCFIHLFTMRIFMRHLHFHTFSYIFKSSSYLSQSSLRLRCRYQFKSKTRKTTEFGN